MTKKKKDKQPMTDTELWIASTIEGLYILLVVLVTLFGISFIFHLTI